MPAQIDPGTDLRSRAVALDAADPLASMRERFALPDGVIYLDGNSLGAQPKATAARVAEVVATEWGRDLIASWNTAGWIDLPRRTGDALAPLVGARPGEVVVADSTSVNLFKVLTLALGLAAAPGRATIVSEADNFPTDLYIAEAVAARHAGSSLALAASDELPRRIDRSTAVLMLTHVNYRTGAMHDMTSLTRAAHAAGALVVWDLAHSAGAVPVDLHAAGADFAVGCGYKYLNGGPGAPAFLWVHPRHFVGADFDHARLPLSGWMGHAAPFAFEPGYRPAAGIEHFLCGTPPVLSMTALACGIASLAHPAGGDAVRALRAKSVALTSLFIDAVEALCGDALVLATPRDPARRGSQVSFHARGALAGHGYALMQALIARGVVGDFRKGRDDAQDILRFGFAPAYLRHADAVAAATILAETIAERSYEDACHRVPAAVT